ncbi:MAG TPA: helix-turn-helix domain-containing protein [Bryobacteraceae bacterium]|jgi:excisionase family DNA binding protein|nr:helix-turn-helix domain-containing protein [Bryobacteraceae bacterium]
MTPANPLSSKIKTACEAAIKEAFHISDLSPRRLLNVEHAAAYLSLSEREVYNMISNKDLAAVRHGRRVMLDIRDLMSGSLHKAAKRRPGF